MKKRGDKRGSVNPNTIWILVIILILAGVFFLFKIQVNFNSRFAIANPDCSFVTNIQPTSINDYDNSNARISLTIDGVTQGYKWNGDNAYGCNSSVYGGNWRKSSIKAVGGYGIITTDNLNYQVLICDSTHSISFNPDNSTDLECTVTGTTVQTSNNSTDTDTSTSVLNTPTNTNLNFGFLTNTIFTIGSFKIALWMIIAGVILIIALLAGGKK